MDVCFRVEYKKVLLLQYSGTYTSFYEKIFGILLILSNFCGNLICHSPTNKFFFYFKLFGYYTISAFLKLFLHLYLFNDNKDYLLV